MGTEVKRHPLNLTGLVTGYPAPVLLPQERGRYPQPLDVKIDKANHAVQVGDKVVGLAGLNWELFSMLADRSQQDVPREEIAAYIAEQGYKQRSPAACITRMRRALEPNPEDPQLILMSYGVSGYRFNANVGYEEGLIKYSWKHRVKSSTRLQKDEGQVLLRNNSLVAKLNDLAQADIPALAPPEDFLENEPFYRDLYMNLLNELKEGSIASPVTSGVLRPLVYEGADVNGQRARLDLSKRIRHLADRLAEIKWTVVKIEGGFQEEATFFLCPLELIEGGSDALRQIARRQKIVFDSLEVSRILQERKNTERQRPVPPKANLAIDRENGVVYVDSVPVKFYTETVAWKGLISAIEAFQSSEKEVLYVGEMDSLFSKAGTSYRRPTASFFTMLNEKMNSAGLKVRAGELFWSEVGGYALNADVRFIDSSEVSPTGEHTVVDFGCIELPVLAETVAPQLIAEVQELTDVEPQGFDINSLAHKPLSQMHPWEKLIFILSASSKPIVPEALMAYLDHVATQKDLRQVIGDANDRLSSRDKWVGVSEEGLQLTSIADASVIKIHSVWESDLAAAKPETTILAVEVDGDKKTLSIAPGHKVQIDMVLNTLMQRIAEGSLPQLNTNVEEFMRVHIPDSVKLDQLATSHNGTNQMQVLIDLLCQEVREVLANRNPKSVYEMNIQTHAGRRPDPDGLVTIIKRHFGY